MYTTRMQAKLKPLFHNHVLYYIAAIIETNEMCSGIVTHGGRVEACLIHVFMQLKYLTLKFETFEVETIIK